MKIFTFIGATLILAASCTGGKTKSDAYGNFEATEYIISSETSGKIVAMTINEGDEVSNSQPFGLVDTTVLSIKKLQLTTTYKKLDAQTSQIGTSLEIYKTQKSVAEREFERVKKMMADNAATQKQYDDIEGQIQILERQINNSRAQYANIEADKTNLDSKVKELDDQLKRSILISPINGVVLEKYVEQGELTSAGKAVIKVANLKEMILRAYISGDQLPHVKIGQKVKVLIDNDSKTNSELEGTVSWISSTSEFTPKIIQTKEERVNLVYAIKIIVPNSGEIKIGMPGEVKF